MATTQAQLNQTAANIAQTVITNIRNGSGAGNPNELILDLANAVLALVAYNQNDTAATVSTTGAYSQNVSITGLKIAPKSR